MMERRVIKNFRARESIGLSSKSDVRTNEKGKIMIKLLTGVGAMAQQ